MSGSRRRLVGRRRRRIPVQQWLRADATVDYRARAGFEGTRPFPTYDVGSIRDVAELDLRPSLNGYVDLGTWSGITPYLGAGVGSRATASTNARRTYLGGPWRPSSSTPHHLQSRLGADGGLAADLGSGFEVISATATPSRRRPHPVSTRQPASTDPNAHECAWAPLHHRVTAQFRHAVYRRERTVHPRARAPRRVRRRPDAPTPPAAARRCARRAAEAGLPAQLLEHLADIGRRLRQPPMRR